MKRNIHQHYFRQGMLALCALGLFATPVLAQEERKEVCHAECAMKIQRCNLGVANDLPACIDACYGDSECATKCRADAQEAVGECSSASLKCHLACNELRPGKPKFD